MYNYIIDVNDATTRLMLKLNYQDMKIKMTENDKETLRLLRTVSEDEGWIIDYWCDKNIQGLIQMPFSRHWIMHIEASNRIVNKIQRR